MSRPKRDFVDVLDVWLETASEDDIRGALASIAVWSRVRKFKFRVRVESINALAPKTANGDRAARSSTPEAKKKDADTPLLDAAEGVDKC